ncbi:choice-of-anchor P family protein [Umezawaea sp.]|uniref:choice-of-anchor P family protein n=1 Tax=Umezawaea sp. TaxID=1955258 RepID=UPI002ED0B541
MRPRHSAVAVLTAFTLVVSAGQAFAVDGNLPGGTGISVAITTPADGTVLPPGPVTVTGTASIGQGQPVANTSITYVLDVSGSTSAGVAAGCGGDQNGDGAPNQILDCEVAAARALNAQAVGLGTVAQVGAAVFGSAGATADVAPAAGDQLTTTPGADTNANGTRDVEEVLASANNNPGGLGLFTARAPGSGSTNFADGITKSTTVATASTTPRKLVVFLSDGMNNGPAIAGPLGAVPADLDYFTFAVGTGSSCGSGANTLQQIADATGGTCTNVPDVAQLPAILPGVISSTLTALTLRVDGGAPIAVTSTTPALPQNGPAAVTYTVDTPALAAGTHELCVTAAGTDGGGNGDVTDCTTITVNAPPVVTPGGPYAGQEGTGVSLAGTVTDPDGPGLTTAWSIAPASGVDPGATCAFGDATQQNTTVTCTDDGVYTVTLTANDGVNAPVAQNATLTLTNVAPAVTITAPATGVTVTRGTPVAFTAPFTDIATNDTHTCTVDFADGTPVVAGTVSQAPGSGTCSTSHAFTALGVHNVLVTITDDDGAAATATVKVVTYLRGEAFALAATGLITVAKTPHATCPPNQDKTTATLTVLGLATVQALHADCTLDPVTGTTTANATVDGATLLGGAITISMIESHCTSGASGITGSSTVGTINGTPIGSGSGSLGIPGVAQVFYNETTTTPSGQLVQNAVRVRTLLGQEIILSGCRLG